VAHLDSVQAWLASLLELQSTTPFTLRVPSAGAHAAGEELSALLPSVPVLSLSKGWIGRLRENYELHEHIEHFRRDWLFLQ